MEAIKSFLKERRRKITGLAAEFLLQEGDVFAPDLVKELLDDPDPQIRLEAALVLSALGDEEKVADLMMKLYPSLQREKQIAVLETMGKNARPSHCAIFN